MKEIKVQAPAKINITLDVIGKREDGFHDLKSIMHAISLYDYLTVRIDEAEGIQIELSGTSEEIPYDNSNLVWKAAEKFLQTAGIENAKVSVYLEKNIPVQAGMAGGSTDGAAMLYALNRLYDNVLSEEQINDICAQLGSDLNFCLKGGCAICTSRGEKIRPIPFLEKPVSVVKPRYLKISAKEAFQEYDLLAHETSNYTDKLVPFIVCGNFDENLMHNDLEEGMRSKYPELNNFKTSMPNSIMSGSGAIFYQFTPEFEVLFDRDEFIVFENLKTIGDGIREVWE
ncbi:MAG: 4-(cytidine 5'-diphospho)-2-C-methyl-D-erythritol kinase [Candidatus Gastranaerophilales bacterium]|nr:4-(cytidine 5'-diphospho)-2-C-methyl-D-erythritol kinase [Candidatus Gastranaerophilales bacterium]